MSETDYVPLARQIVATPCGSVELAPLEILDMLQSRICVCGAAKDVMRSHCTICYRSMPPELQKGLYKRFRKGYEQAFMDSVGFLIELGATDSNRVLLAVPKTAGAQNGE